MMDPAGESRREDVLKVRVRERYGGIARSGGCCARSTDSSGCCGEATTDSCGSDAGGAARLGYSSHELEGLPDGANLGLGCGNPTGLLSLKPGEVVLDLGSAAGIDCFLAARKVGPTGRVIGVDMTPEMVAKARANARTGGYDNVEFRLGEMIEHLPVPDGSVDVVISNCVINLAPDKTEVYREAFRALRPGGRFAVSDVVATRPIRPEERQDPSLWSSCSSGALEIHEITSLLRDAGFKEVDVQVKVSELSTESLQDPARLVVVPADIRAVKLRD